MAGSIALERAVDRALGEVPAGATLHVALSGGRDSVVLLHLALCARQRLAPERRPSLAALHIDHALQPAAIEFVHFCRTLCHQWAIPLRVIPVTVDAFDGLEAGARRARYAAFTEQLACGDVLWMAHHRGDQAETLLLRLMRGAGVAGLAGMPYQRSLGRGLLMRPLLAAGSTEIADYARQHDLPWREDPTNQDERFDRNHVRHRVMPALNERWTAEAQLVDSANHLREAGELLGELAAIDLERLGHDPGRLPLVPLLELSRARQRLLIRSCLGRLGLPLPPRARLETLLDQCAEARRDGRVHVGWPGAEARVWRGALYLQTPTDTMSGEWQCCWQGEVGLDTPVGALYWRLVREDGKPVSVRLKPRRGGERLQYGGRHRRVKQLLQEAAVPPWRRDRLVIAWQGDEAVALIGADLALAADGWRLLRAGT
ncbi:tRNA lysidine(34) synthetase TilS [Kushneria phosphatilytica]|nr:tRNA lysidine(34) synthetase TilS [Kushneria phosphatilytica]OHV10485.1 tRNA lysidine(34) synthetase TilS [Kushneria phosphatilytica]